ncbi:hypothetical protein HDU84_004420 [Entophlyctis sp. JEL0112]|nr:hypothetical protein HDU84_004420 [Entophlyctis sp. JEL0112]
MFLSPNVGIDRLVVGRNCSGCKSYLYAAGQFYTMSLPMIDHLSELYYRNPPTKYVEEDALNGLLLLSNHETSPVNYTFVHVANEYAFDWDPDSNDTSANNHQVGVESLNPHKMKRDKDYLHVSGMFGKHGIIPDRLNNVRPI